MKVTNKQTDKCISESVVNVFFMSVWVEGRSCQNPLTQHHLHPTERQTDKKTERWTDNQTTRKREGQTKVRQTDRKERQPVGDRKLKDTNTDRKAERKHISGHGCTNRKKQIDGCDLNRN